MTKDPEPGDDRKSIERELKRGSLELIVLHLLASGEAYGYEIVSKLTAETNGALEVTDGTLYPVLYRLERAGSVTVRWETPERGVPRKYYRLTDTGRDELARLTHEWTTFAKAMTKLLRQVGRVEVTTADDYVNTVLGMMPPTMPQRQQIAAELRSHIAERLAHGHTLDAVLRQLGDPAALADSYLSAEPLVSAPFGSRAVAKLAGRPRCSRRGLSHCVGGVAACACRICDRPS